MPKGDLKVAKKREKAPNWVFCRGTKIALLETQLQNSFSLTTFLSGCEICYFFLSFSNQTSNSKTVFCNHPLKSSHQATSSDFWNFNRKIILTGNGNRTETRKWERKFGAFLSEKYLEKGRNILRDREILARNKFGTGGQKWTHGFGNLNNFISINKNLFLFSFHSL